MQKRVLVMGGSGYIGRNIVSYFEEKGEITDVYDLFVTDDRKRRCYQGDVLNDPSLREIISNYDTLIYLISSVSPKKSMEEPSLAYEKDLPMLLKVLDISREVGCNRVIFASSGGTVYGEGAGRELTEDSYCQPINHYAIAKLAAEDILLLYNRLHGMQNIILRIANPYGIGQNPKSGVGAITIFADRILNHESITLYADKDTVRDYVHVKSVARAFYQATQYKFNDEITPVFNIGSGIGLSLSDIIRLIEETLNVQADVAYLATRGFDVKRNVLNIEKAKKYLGYESEGNEMDLIREYIREMEKRNRK